MSTPAPPPSVQPLPKADSIGIKACKCHKRHKVLIYSMSSGNGDLGGGVKAFSDEATGRIGRGHTTLIS